MVAWMKREQRVMARTLPNKLRVAGAFGFLLVAVAIATASPGEPVDAIVPEMMEDDPTLIELEGEELEFLESPLTATTYARGKASRLAFDQGKFATLLQKVRSGTSAFILTGLRESGGDHMHVTASEPFKNTKMVTQRNGSEHSATPPQVVVMVGHMQDQPTDSTVSIACESNGCHGILQQIIDGQVHTETIDTRPVSADKPDGDALITLHPPSETQLPQVAEDFWDINDDPIEDLTESVLQNILNAPGPSPAQFGNTTASELNLIGKDSSSAKEVFGGSATNNLGYLHQALPATTYYMQLHRRPLGQLVTHCCAHRRENPMCSQMVFRALSPSTAPSRSLSTAPSRAHKSAWTCRDT